MRVFSDKVADELRKSLSKERAKQLQYIHGTPYTIEEADELRKSFAKERAKQLQYSHGTPFTIEEVDLNESEEEELTNTKRYGMADGRQLFDHIEEMLTPDEIRGIYKFNVMKYTLRYREKAGIKDLDKAIVYLNQLKGFEVKQNETK